jgi:hypothetical protein
LRPEIRPRESSDLPLVGLPALVGSANAIVASASPVASLGSHCARCAGLPAPRDREARERVAEERHRQCALADHLRSEREVEHLERAAAVLVGQREAGHADLDESLPQRRVVPVPASKRGRKSIGGHSAVAKPRIVSWSRRCSSDSPKSISLQIRQRARAAEALI